jgi:hypothetical protein
MRESDVCPTCGWGDGKVRLRPMNPDGTPHPPPGPCSTCGRTPTVIKLRKIILPSPLATADAVPID